MTTLRTDDGLIRYRPRWYGMAGFTFRRPRVYTTFWARVAARIVTFPFLLIPSLALFLAVSRDWVGAALGVVVAVVAQFMLMRVVRDLQERYTRPETPIRYWVGQVWAQASAPAPPEPATAYTIPHPTRTDRTPVPIGFTTDPRTCDHCENPTLLDQACDALEVHARDRFARGRAPRGS